MKIAIIGAGVSGLVAAYHLRHEHDITVFEAESHIGGHTHTHEVEWGGEHHRIDTGFIVFNEPNYPHFTRLLTELGVASAPTSMSFSVRCDRLGLEYNGSSLNRLFAQRTNLLRPSFHRMVRDILRFGREAPALLREPEPGPSVEQWVEQRGYGREFVEHYLVPLGAALWSCPLGTFRQFAMRFVVDFLYNHHMLQIGGRPVWRVVRGGSSRYVEVLVAHFRDRIRTRCPVQRVERDADEVRVYAGSGAETFDHVVFACHSDQALKMLAQPSPLEQQALGAMPYQVNDVWLHTDASMLPRRRLAWASWNARLMADEPARAVVTYNMNILQGLRSRHTFCVTLNHGQGIDPDKVIRKLVYHHPLYLAGREHARRRHGELLHHHRSSYCGAYWGYGFHEDGVRTALAVCEAIREQHPGPADA
jgi:predicted NAD/FAD-binding protein